MRSTGAYVIVKDSRALARVAHPVEIARVAGAADQGAPEQALKIKSRIRLQASSLPHPGKEARRHAEAAELTPGENVDVIDAFIAAQKRRPFRVDDPGDIGGGISGADEGRGRQSVDDIA